MGNMMNKYRVHEVAKDFGLPTKTITEILTKYASAPKNHMQVLSDEELSIIFDYLTQHNQVSGIEVIFSEVYQEEKPAPQPEQPAKAAAAQPSAAPAKGETGRWYAVQGEQVFWMDEDRLPALLDSPAELRVFEEREKMLKYVLDAVEQGFRIQ